MPLGWGVSVGGIENIRPEFAAKYGKSAIYLSVPFGFPDEFNVVKWEDKVGSIYAGFFISRPEHDFFQANGARAFEEAFAKSGVDPYQLRRPVIGGM
jgi:hypothetical protein